MRIKQLIDEAVDDTVWRVDFESDFNRLTKAPTIFTMFVRAKDEEDAVYKVGGSVQFVRWITSLGYHYQWSSPILGSEPPSPESEQFADWITLLKSDTEGSFQPYPFHPLPADRDNTCLQINKFDSGEAIYFWTVKDAMTGDREFEGHYLNFSVRPAPGVEPSPFTQFRFMNPEQREAWEQEHLGLKFDAKRKGKL